MRTSVQPSDKMRKSIFDRFYWDSRVDDYSNIEVEITGGKVTLSGSVPSYPTRRHAETAAAGVPGVTSVENRLAVKYHDTMKIPSDLEIETRVLSIIRWNSAINEGRMSVSANAGYVTLDGNVPSYYQKFRAQELAADVIGVVGIDNRLAVVPDGSFSDEEIAANVVHTLKTRLGSDANSLTVMVRGGIVTLTGTVPDIIAFHGVENIVRHARGITDLHNHLVTESN